MKTIALWFVGFHPCWHYVDPDRPLWANRQDIFVTYTGVYYEYVQWPVEHELWIGYRGKPYFKVKTWKNFLRN